MARSRSGQTGLPDVRPHSTGAAVARLDSIPSETDVVYDVLDGPVDCLFKTLRAPPDDPTAALDQGFVQHRLAGLRGGHWARVLEYRPARDSTKVPTGGAIVFPYYPGSAQRLITQLASPRPRQLHAIVAGVLDGLVELRKHFNRPHGNLKPTNVLFDVAAPSSPRQVALTDPAPGATARRRGPATDLLRVGELIHLLVLHRLPRTPEDWAVPPAPEWQRLGRRRGRRWRELCQRLVSPRGPELSLDQAAGFVRRSLKPNRLVTRPAVLLLLAAGVAAGITVGPRQSYEWLAARQRALVPTRDVAVIPPPTPTQPQPLSPPVAVAPSPAPPAGAARHVTQPTVEAAAVPVPVPRVNLPPVVVDVPDLRRAALATLGRANSLSAAASSDVARLTQAVIDHWIAARHRAGVAQFIAECARPAPPGMTPELAAEWDRLGRAFADAARRTPAQLPADVRQQRDRTIARLLSADAALAASRTAGSTPSLPVVQSPTAREVRAALARSLADGTEGRAREAVTLVNKADAPDAAFTAGLKAMRAAALAQRTEAAALLGDVDAVDRRLAEGWTLADPLGPDGPRRTIGSVISGWRGGRALAIPGVAPALAALVGAAVDVEQAQAPHLMKLAAAGDQPLGVRLSAWQQLGSPAGGVAWPATADDLKQAVALRDAISAVAAALKDRTRSTAITTSVARDFADRWGRVLAGRAGDAPMRAALAIRDEVKDVDPAALPPEARWNVALDALRRAAASKEPDAPRRKRDAASAAVSAAAALPSSAPAPVTELASRLRAWTAAADAAAPTDFSQLGPCAAAAGAGGALRWKAEADAGGDVVTYRAQGADPAARDGSTLYFRRVSAATTGDVYLCTTEAPLGLVIDAVAYAGRWDDLRQRGLMGRPDANAHDLRPGPRVWEWSPRRDGGINKSLVWLSNEWLPDGADHYPDALGAEFNRTALRPPPGERIDALNPSRRQPMQYVPAGAASYVAALLGCRLPTPQEWKLAYADSPKLRGANLRDDAWRQEYEHLLRSWPRGTYRPDAGAFVPPGEQQSNDVWRLPDGDAYRDGVLWFREVLPPAADPRAFHDLAGNVAEFVRDPAGTVYVIGGSALSPPSRPIDAEAPLDERALARGYADVGFRLAFTAPPRPEGTLAAILAGDGGYIVTAH